MSSVLVFRPMGIEGLLSFFNVRETQEIQPMGPDPVTVAACALLLEIAHADVVFRPEEERKECVDLFHFTQLLRESLTRDQRLRLVEAIWGVVYSDGSLQ